jgi:hypothetical protein
MLEHLKILFSYMVNPVKMEYPIREDGSQQVDWQPWMGEIYTGSGDGCWMIDQEIVNKNDPGYIYAFIITNHRVQTIWKEPESEYLDKLEK